MSATDVVSVEVPDIGDFDDVPVIEILVSPGDTVAVDDPLLTLESDKATMDVPAPFAGVVRELHVNVGDRVSQGALLLTMEPSDAASAPSTASAVASEGAPTEAAAPDAVSSATQAEEAASTPAQPEPAPPRRRRGRLRQPLGPPRRPRARRRPHPGDRKRPQGPDHARGRGGVCVERPGPGFAGRAWFGPRPAAVAIDRLREVRARRARPALADPAHLRPRTWPATG